MNNYLHISPLFRQIVAPNLYHQTAHLQELLADESSEEAVNPLLRQILAPNSPLLSVRLQDTLVDKSSEEKFGAKIHLNTGFISTVVDLSVSDE